MLGKWDARVIEYWDARVTVAQKHGLNLCVVLIGLIGALVALSMTTLITQGGSVGWVVFFGVLYFAITTPFILVLMGGLDYRENARRAQELNKYVLAHRDSWARKASVIVCLCFFPMDAIGLDRTGLVFDLVALALFYTSCAAFIPGSTARKRAPAALPESAP